MRFLCLHGLATTCEILEAQTASLRFELGDDHEYDYCEGTLPLEIAAELAAFYPAATEGFAYFDATKPDTFTAALNNLEEFIAREGPYDGIIGFSHGAQLAASLLVRPSIRDRVIPLVKCAIFLSGGIPYAFDEKGDLRHMDPDKTGPLIDLPTANIWGANDTLYPNTSNVLYKFCKPEYRSVFIHQGGHEIPGANMKEDLINSTKAVRRTLDLALTLQ